MRTQSAAERFLRTEISTIPGYEVVTYVGPASNGSFDMNVPMIMSTSENELLCIWDYGIFGSRSTNILGGVVTVRTFPDNETPTADSTSRNSTCTSYLEMD